MQKFEDSFDGAYYSSGKKNPQQGGKRSKIIINVAGTWMSMQRRNIPWSSMWPSDSGGT